MTGLVNVLRAVVTAKAKGVEVVELEPIALGASSAVLVHVSASVSVALAHGTLDRSRDMA